MKAHPLKTWRATKGLTQDEAAKLVGVTKQCWQLWETGARVPHSGHVRILMQRTGIRPDAIYAAAS